MLLGLPHKELGAEAYYYVMIDTPNDMTSDLKYRRQSLMVGCKQTNKQTNKNQKNGNPSM